MIERFNDLLIYIDLNKTSKSHRNLHDSLHAALH